MARTTEIMKLERERQKIKSEIKLLERRIHLKQIECEVVADEISHAISFSRKSKKSEEIKEKLKTSTRVEEKSK